MAKQTATEWLCMQLLDLDNHKIWVSLLERAKNMEKEQIIEAFTKGELVKDNYFDYANPYNIKGINYYKKTYGNNK